MHGVDVSSDGQIIYVSGRGDGYIHIFNYEGIYLESIPIGSMSMLGGINVTKVSLPDLGDSNNDGIIDVIDIVVVVNYIVNETMLSPYEEYATDFNSDEIIDVIDIVSLVNVIMGLLD